MMIALPVDSMSEGEEGGVMALHTAPDAYSFHDPDVYRFADLIDNGIAVVLDPPQMFGWLRGTDQAEDIELGDANRAMEMEKALPTTTFLLRCTQAGLR